VSALFGEQMLVLFAILALGSWLGSLSLRGVSLGTAAVFFVGLAFGHFGLTVPKPVMDLGLLLFLYSVGLQAGPRFFRTFRKQGWQFVAIAAAAIGAAGMTTFVLARALDLPAALATGMFTGAVTNTPSLAAAIDAVTRLDPEQAATVSVGYGIAYPFSIVGITLFIQFLPKLLRRPLAKAEEEWQAAQDTERPLLAKCQFRVTNPNLDGRRLGDLETHRLSQANISRVQHGGEVVAGTPDVLLHLGDIVLVVGPREELDKMRLLIGEETETPMETNTRAVSRDLYVTETNFAGKRLMDLRVWDRYGVIITRIRRAGVELTLWARARWSLAIPCASWATRPRWISLPTSPAAMPAKSTKPIWCRSSSG
jgi:putative transport protein